MRLALLCIVAATAGLAVTVEPALACSCFPGDPRTALARADAAFVGVLLERREGSQPIADVTLVFRVEERIKGPLGGTVEVVTAQNTAACGVGIDVGGRTGLLLDRVGGRWRGNLCGQMSPSGLREAARPLPAPNGSGPVAFVIGGQFGQVRTITLDRQGRTLAYGRGPGGTTALSVCPGGRRVAESARGNTRTLVVRELRTLRIVHRLTLRYPGPFRCEDAAGSAFVVLATNDKGEARLLRVSLGRTATIWRGTARNGSLGDGVAYLNTGKGGRILVRLDLRTRRVTRLARLPAFTGALAPSPDGTRLAGVVSPEESENGWPPSRLVVVERGRVRTTSLGAPSYGGEVFWLPGRRLAVFPFHGDGIARVYDLSLRIRSSVPGWNAEETVLVGSTAFGLGYDGSLLTASLPRGAVHVLRRLPSPATYALATVPR